MKTKKKKKERNKKKRHFPVQNITSFQNIPAEGKHHEILQAVTILSIAGSSLISYVNTECTVNTKRPSSIIQAVQVTMKMCAKCVYLGSWNRVAVKSQPSFLHVILLVQEGNSFTA